MLYVITGCSCGGKTTLINALASRGYRISDEPGRIIVREELKNAGGALPWVNPAQFAFKCVQLSVQHYGNATQSCELVFFDRSLIDAVSALMSEEPGIADQYANLLTEYRYAETVFMAPPWPEIFENDVERMHTFEESVAEYDRLVTTYAAAGYSIQTLPKTSIPERIDFILEHIE